MKNSITSLFTLIAFLFVFSCEGPAGLDGQDGQDGTNGVDGVDGVAGADGTAVCISCHNVETNDLVTAAYELSTHGTSAIQWDGSTTVEYAGTRNGCAKCHSNEGFIETQITGLDTTAVDPLIPQNIQCATCHDFHETLDFSEGMDYAIRSHAAPVELDIDASVVLDFGDNSNLCANCHQPRGAAPVDDGTGNFAVTSPYYGPHHSPQSTMLEGIGAYEFASVTYPAGPTTHREMSSCTTCHMTGDPADHDFFPTAEAACNQCHTNTPEDFDLNGKKTEIIALLETLEGHLTTAGILSGGRAVPGTYPADQAGAFFNYKLVEEDQSHGIHNPAYATAILEASIDVFAP